MPMITFPHRIIIIYTMKERNTFHDAMVQIVLHTETADTVYDMMNQGLVDIGLFIEPVSTEGLDYIRIMDSDHWVVGIKPDDPLACKEYIRTGISGFNRRCRKVLERGFACSEKIVS